MDDEAPRPTDDEGDHFTDVLRRDFDLAAELPALARRGDRAELARCADT